MRNSSDDDFDDEEWDSDEDSDIPTTVFCPHCEAETDDESLVCPVCSKSLSGGTGPWAGKSAGWQMLMVVVVLILLALMFLPFF